MNPKCLALYAQIVIGAALIPFSACQSLPGTRNPEVMHTVTPATATAPMRPSVTPLPTATQPMTAARQATSYGVRTAKVQLQSALPNPGNPLAKVRLADLASGDANDWDIELVSTVPGRSAEIVVRGLYALESAPVDLERCREVLGFPRAYGVERVRIATGIAVCVRTWSVRDGQTMPAIAMAKLVSTAPNLATFEVTLAPVSHAANHAQPARPEPTQRPTQPGAQAPRS